MSRTRSLFIQQPRRRRSRDQFDGDGRMGLVRRSDGNFRLITGQVRRILHTFGAENQLPVLYIRVNMGHVGRPRDAGRF